MFKSMFKSMFNSMFKSTKKFDTYEDFVEHMTMLLSHNEYPSDTNVETILYFVKEISKKLDSNTMMWESNAGWNFALDYSNRNLGIVSGFTFSDPQTWGIVGLTDKQILVLYSCVHSILLTGARDLDEWRSITKPKEIDTSGCLPFLLCLAIAGIVLYIIFSFITDDKHYPRRLAEIERAFNWNTVTSTSTTMPTKTPTPIVPTAIVPTETSTPIGPTATPDKWLNLDFNNDSRPQFNEHIQIMIRILSVIEIKDSDYDRNICKNPVPEGAKEILVNIEAKNVGEDVVQFPSDFRLNDKYYKKSDDIGFCLKKSTIKYPSSLANAYPGVSSSFATLRFRVPVAFDRETAFMSVKILMKNNFKSFHFYQ